jgi:NDP-sugar pyrophosphorylase family protein
VWDGASIGKGAHVSDSIVGLNFTIFPDQALDGAIVANEPVA